MKTHRLHPWNISVEQARAIQKNLSAWVIREGSCKQPKLLARIELACSEPSQARATVQASVSIRSLPTLKLLERKVSLRATDFPAIEGLASFRKVPAVIAALEKLVRIPDVIICDGRGRTGEDSFGVATHVGLITHIPTVGVSPAKPRQLTDLLGTARGSWIPVPEAGEDAALVRLLDGLDPLLISPAHKLSMEDAITHVLSFVPANTPARDYIQSLYPEAGITGATGAKLTLVASRRPG